jgi:hypothetical protein
MGKDPFDFERLDAFGVAVDIVAAVDIIAGCAAARARVHSGSAAASGELDRAQPG